MASENILKQKEEEVSVLAEKMKNAKLILLTDYRGITVDDVTSLRNDLRNVNAQYKVIKNNIVKRALAANGENSLDAVLEGPTAVIISEEDYLAPLKAIYNFSKDNDYYQIKGGIVEGKVLSVEELITLAKLPSRQELLGMLAGALLGNISKVAVALDQVRLQKEGANA
ncbi:MAG: 50S ribosomal protein L10 [Clostridia bacterium]